jgi:hypothetical protein
MHSDNDIEKKVVQTITVLLAHKFNMGDWPLFYTLVYSTITKRFWIGVSGATV